VTRQLFSFFRLSPSLFLFSFSPFTSLSSISPSLVYLSLSSFIL